MKIIWLSNGHGEDRIAQVLIQKWRQLYPQDHHQALVMVGTGQAYGQIQVPLIAPTFQPPSAGFAYTNPVLLWRDIQGGLWPHLRRQCRALQKAREQNISLWVAVGDIVPLGALASARVLGAHTAFVACALSDYYTAGKSCFDPVQVALLRRYGVQTYARDALTAENLVRRGVQAYALGNPMRDAVGNDSLPASDPEQVQALLLPGSHTDAVANLAYILPLLAQAVQLVQSVQDGHLPQRQASALHWWVVVAPEVPWEAYEALLLPYARVLSIRLLPATAFGSALQRATFALGLSGTGNEQCVAHGVPVVSFPGAPEAQQYTYRFAEAQQRLLGAALRFYPVISAEILAWQVAHFLRVSSAYHRMTRQIGAERFGLPGAAERVVQHIRAGSV